MTLLIVGKSSTGKSSSFRNLDMSKTVLVNAEAKTPPFKAHKKLYKHVYPSSTTQVLNGMKQMEEEEGKLTIIIDSISMLMDMFYAERVKNAANGLGAWSDYKDYFLELINFAKRSKHDYIFTALAKDSYNESEYISETFASVQGSLFKNIESHFTVVLHTVVVEEDGELKHKFITNKDVNNKGLSCKSPFEMFDEKYIDNDVTIALKAMHEYYEED